LLPQTIEEPAARIVVGGGHVLNLLDVLVIVGLIPTEMPAVIHPGVPGVAVYRNARAKTPVGLYPDAITVDLPALLL